MADPPQEGAVVADRYRIMRCLKRGGMGGVYQVLDLQTDRLRALKMMLTDTAADADLRQRFEQEAIIAGRIRSDHVVSVTDSGMIEGGTRFIAMELLEGRDLAAAGPLAPGEVLSLLSQVALGLEKIHAHAIVHRDLKPENIFVCTRDDGTPMAKILDFGIAKSLATMTTLATTRALGTPLYMAPEQLTGDAAIDARADLYSLAHTAYTLLVGVPYWLEEAKSAPSAHAFCNKVIAGVAEPPTRRARGCDVALPAGFDAWFAKATATSPDERFDDAGDMIAALADAFDGGPPRATRRPRYLTAAAAIVALGVLLALWRIYATPADSVARQQANDDPAPVPTRTPPPPPGQMSVAEPTSTAQPPEPRPAAPRAGPPRHTPTAAPHDSGQPYDPLDHL